MTPPEGRPLERRTLVPIEYLTNLCWMTNNFFQDDIALLVGMIVIMFCTVSVVAFKVKSGCQKYEKCGHGPPPPLLPPELFYQMGGATPKMDLTLKTAY